MKLGDYLKNWRQAEHLSQSDAGQRLGVNRDTISRYERGVCYPRGYRARKELAEALEISYETLYGEPEPLVVRKQLDVERRKIGQKIRDYRLMHGLNQVEFAARVSPDLHQSVVTKWERGETYPRRKWRARVAEVLGMSYESLFGGAEAAHRWGEIDIGRRLRIWREQHQITQTEAADLLGTTSGKYAISTWENGRRIPTPEYRQRMECLLEMSDSNLRMVLKDLRGGGQLLTNNLSQLRIA